jgi:hypothetical protein
MYQVWAGMGTSTGEFAGLVAAYGRSGWKAGYGMKAFWKAGWAVDGWDEGGSAPERSGFCLKCWKVPRRKLGRRSLQRLTVSQSLHSSEHVLLLIYCLACLSPLAFQIKTALWILIRSRFPFWVHQESATWKLAWTTECIERDFEEESFEGCVRSSCWQRLHNAAMNDSTPSFVLLKSSRKYH